jgi:hypothetical protein
MSLSWAAARVGEVLAVAVVLERISKSVMLTYLSGL